MNMLSKSVAFAGMKFTFASPASARAKSVFPFPGAPSKRIPLGILIPFALYAAGFFMMSAICIMSFFKFSIPTMSLNFTPVLCTVLKVFGEINFLNAKIMTAKKIT